MPLSKRSKKTVFISIFTLLILFEMCMLTAFLPNRWQHALSQQLVRFQQETHDQSMITHPDLEGEIDQALRENPGLRIALNVTFGILLAGNTFLITRVWRALKSKA